MSPRWTGCLAGPPARALLALFAMLAAPAHASTPPATADTGPTSAGAAMTDSQREAVSLLRRMTEHLAGLEAFSFGFRDGYDVVQQSGQKIEFGETRRVTIARPDRLRVEEVSSDGKRDLAIFDGKNISVLDADAGVYAQAAQPGSVDDALGYFVRSLRIRMPLGLLLTKNLPEALAGRIKGIDYVERTDLLGVPTHHVAGRGENVDFQFWITEDDHPLPLRVVITYVHAEGQPQFWANFSDWNTQPKLTPATFRFTAPQGAKKIPFAVQLRVSPNGAAPAAPGAQGQP